MEDNGASEAIVASEEWAAAQQSMAAALAFLESIWIEANTLINSVFKFRL